MSEGGWVLRRGRWSEPETLEGSKRVGKATADTKTGPRAGPAGVGAPEHAPKQIIYPMRYLRPLLSRDETAEARFRARLQEFLASSAHIVPLGRARAGIYLLAKFARSDTRRRVIMMPYTIPDVVNMVRFAGCEPVFVDTLPNSTNVDIDHLRELIDENTCCVLVTHYHVNQNGMGDIVDLCRSRNVLLFDDCAIALEGDYAGARMGSVADASVFSMSGFKSLNYIWGGAVATMRDDIAEALEREVAAFPRLAASQYRRHMSAVLKYDLATREPVFSRVTLPAVLRQAERGGDALALQRIETERLEDTVLSRPAFGAMKELTRKLCAVDAHLAHRKAIAAIYDRSLADHRVAPETTDDVRAGSCFVNYPVVVDPQKRDRVYRDLLRDGFHVGQSLYPNVHETETLRGIAGRSRNVAALVRSAITLPTHPRIRSGYAQALANALTQAMCRMMPFFCIAV